MDITELPKKIDELERRLSVLEASFGTVGTSGESPKRGVKPPSAKEFLLSKKFTTELDKTLALGYYLEYTEGATPFNTSDLTESFKSAREKPPKNLNDAVNKNISRGYIMEDPEGKDNKKAWVLTNSGEEFVEKWVNQD